MSIVIPVYNEATGLADFLSRLSPIQNQYVEIIVVDGGSQDETVRIAKQLVDKVYQSALGRAQQMNTGADAASGDWLLFLHADTVLPDSFTDCMMQILDGEKQWGFFRVKLSGNDLSFRIIERFINWRSRMTKIGTGDQCHFIKRDLFVAMGGYPLQPLMEDVELCKRLKLQGLKPFAFKKSVTTSSRRWEKKGVWKTVLLMWQLRWAYWRGVSPEILAIRYNGGTNVRARDTGQEK